VTEPARTVFLGSGEFAIPIVTRLADHPAIDLLALVSAPPRPRGRGGRVTLSPAGAWAERRGLPLLTPARLRDPAAIADVLSLRPSLLVLADYGQLVPAELLDLPHGALNIHPSLLPRHRGASPIAAAILAGDERTGVTVMRMDAGLDSGPIVAQRPFEMAGDESAAELESRLADLGAGLLAETIEPWLDGTLEPTAQPTEGATLSRPLRRADGRLDPNLPAAQLERQVRAYQPWPGSWLDTSAGRLIVWRAVPLPAHDGQPGMLIGSGDERRERRLGLVTADGLLDLLELQLAGGRRQSAAELLRGHPAVADSRVLPAPRAGSDSSG
jgi:methionyl-tRNA formyltransferase